MTDLIKQSEQNLVNICKSFQDAFEIFKALQSFGNKYCHDFIAKEEFFEGMEVMRRALFNEQSFAISQCFIFSGVGGDAAKEYSREMFKKYFSEDERYCIMDFLDKYGQIPSSYKSDDEDEFRKQANEKIKEME